MFVVDEEAAAAIRRAWEEGGEPAGAVELRRHFPLIADNEQARRCVRAVVGFLSGMIAVQSGVHGPNKDR